MDRFGDINGSPHIARYAPAPDAGLPGEGEALKQ